MKIKKQRTRACENNQKYLERKYIIVEIINSSKASRTLTHHWEECRLVQILGKTGYVY